MRPRSPRLAPVDRAWLRAAATVIAAGLAIMLLSWHALALEPQPGLDGSWEAALHMALHDEVTFGNHLVFTYGPLGFLSVPTLWYGDTGSVAVLYTVLLRLALASALFVGARRSYGTAAGAIVALLVTSASDVALEPVPFLAFGVWMIDRDVHRRGRLALMAAGGAAAGLELLNKESVGIELAAMAIIVALAARGRRRENMGVALVALLAALVAGWVVTGQDLGALPAYAHNAEQIISGYAAAMGIEQPGVAIALQYPAAVLAVAIGLAGALHMIASGSAASGSARRRWGIVAIWLAFCFFEYKEGFVRHDAGHAAEFFIAVMGGFLAFSWRAPRRLVGLGMTAVLLAFAVAATVGANENSLAGTFDPVEHVSSAVTQLYQVSSRSERDSLMARGRRGIEAAFPLDPATLSLLRGHTVHVAPYQAAVAWAYGLDWRPLPVFQSYTAYTSGLDQDDADALNSARAPQRILRNLEPGIDGRVQTFDEGLTTRTILCRYQQLHTTATWQVLARGPDRCGAPRALETVHAGWDQSVLVPAPPNTHSFVFVRIGGVAVGGLEGVSALLYKPAERTVLLDGSKHRLLPGTAADGLLLRAPATLDYTPPFNLAPNPATIAVGKAGQRPGGGKPLTFSFYAQSLSARSRTAASSR
jgi:hypothetical protein